MQMKSQENTMFRNSTLQRIIASALLASFASSTVAPVVAFAQNSDSFTLQPLVGTPGRGLPGLDANGIPTGKGWQRNGASNATNAASTATAAPTQAYGFALAQLEAMAHKSDADLAAGRGSDALTQVNAVRAQYARLKKEEPAMSQAFAATEAHLRAAGLAGGEILARHQQAVQDFNARNAELKAAMAALDAAAGGKGGLQAALNQLSKLMKQHTSLTGQGAQGKVHAWGKLKKAPPAVAMTERQHEKRFPRSVLLAAAGSLSGIALPDAILPDSVQPGDLAEQGEVVLTPAVRALAAQLGNNPVAIYNWVRNNIAYAPGFGAMHDADATLLARRGNATDTASLLIALNRAAGIPSRYVYGTIEVPIERLRNWLGVDSAAAAQALLSQAGIPHRGVTQAGQVGALQLEHVWVEAYVDYSPSRGGVNRTPGAWVPLDASFKQMDSKAGLDLASAVSLNESGLLSQVRQGAVCTPDYAQNLNLQNLQAGYTDYKTRLNSYLGQQGADLTVGDVLGSRNIAARNYSILLGSLPYTKVAQGAIVNTLPDNLRWQFRLQLFAGAAEQAANNPSVSYSGSLAAVANKRLTLSFTPASQADADVLASYMPKPHADGSPIQPSELPLEVPGYLVRVKAEIRADGEVVASGGSFVLGSELAGGIASFDPSSGNWNESAFNAHAGDYHAVAIDAQGVSSGQLATVKARLNATQAKLAGGQGAGLTRDDVSGDLLYHAVLGYFATVDANAGVFQRAARVVEQRLPSYGRAVAQAQPEMVLGIVGKVRFQGIVLDIDRLDSAVVQGSGGLAPAAYIKQANERNAAYGHLVLAKLFTSVQTPGQAASPVKALNAAASAGSKVFAVTAANAAAVLPQVDIAAAAAADIQNTVAAGSRALVAQAPVNIGNWNGHGLVMEDANGAGSYRLHGEAGYATAALYLPNGTTWLALAEPMQAASAAAPAAQAAMPVNDTLASLLGEAGSTTRWSFYAGQADVASGLFLARLAAGQGSSACDILTGTIAAGLDTSGGFDSGAVAGAPVITSAPVISGGANQLYNYAVLATDPKGSALAYVLREAPTGMAISADGVISWPKPVAGTWNVTVRADNGRAYAEQRYQLTVGQQVPLDANLKITPQVINLGETVTIDVLSTGGSGNVTRSLTIDGQGVALTVEGRATVTGAAIGAHQITATIADSIGTTTRVGTYSVRDPADSTTPVAQITAPVDDAEVTAPVNVTGTATATNLAYYQLLLRPAGGSAWSEIARGTTAVTNGVLGKLDPTQLANGIYELVLNVVDANGRQQTQMITVDVYGDLKIGQFAITFQDLKIETSGIPIRINRTYDTRRKADSLDFGYGWSVDYQSLQVRKNMILGLQWEVIAASQQLSICLRPIGKRKVNVTLPNGKVERFSAANRSECAVGTVPSVDVVFTSLPGTNSELELVNVPNVMARGGQLYDMDNLEPWNPTDYKLTTDDGYIYYLKEGVGITQVKDPAGNTLTYGKNGILHSNGQSISFQRDAKQRITRVIDPNGKAIQYVYNASGDLVSVTNRVNGLARYSYNRSHGLVEYSDPNGALVARYVYDEEGRLIAAYDAEGKAIEYTHATSSNREIVKDRRGNSTTFVYDESGNILERTDALGNTTKYSYDAQGNEIEIIDAMGGITQKTYNKLSNKLTTEKDPLGNVSTWTYDGRGTVLQDFTDPKGNLTYLLYGEKGQSVNEPLGRQSSVSKGLKGLITGIRAAGVLTTYGHDEKGNRIRETDANGNTSTYAFDANNREISKTWSRTVPGRAEVITESIDYKYDAEGRPTEFKDPLGLITKTEYNAGNQIVATIAPDGQRTSYQYNSRGLLARTSFPDGTAESHEYDEEGNEIAFIDRQGRTTRNEYDALNRLSATVRPNGDVSRTEYDALGRVSKRINAVGQSVEFKYDASGRMLSYTNAAGRTTTFKYDGNGNRIAIGDGLGRETRYEYDALDRVVKIIAPDETFTTTEWNLNNTKRAEVDAAGNRTEYSYDSLGKLTQVKQTSNLGEQLTAYTFDSAGNKVSQVDAEGRTTQWRYDGLRRLVERILPSGYVERSTYDTSGNTTGRTSFAGKTTSFAKDAQTRSILEVRPDGDKIERRYSPTGRLLAVIISTAPGSALQPGKTDYQYDALDRLVKRTDPDGHYIAYTYDANDNITLRSTAAGSVSYEYTADNRISKVKDSDGQAYSYTYDAAGRVVREESAGGKVRQLQYDKLGRLLQIVDLDRDGRLQFGVSYTLAISGERLTKLEFDASSSFVSNVLENPVRRDSYTYSAGRLTSEEVRDRQNEVLKSITYSYDKVGNRLQATITTPAGTESISYSYDVNDRLLREQRNTVTGSQVVTDYTWDANGNMLSKVSGSTGQFYTWDANNRLVEIKGGSSVSTASTIVRYSYDAAGHRVARTVLSDRSSSTRYLTDTTFPDARVLEETESTGDGERSMRFVWGEKLLWSRIGDQSTFYHADGLGSIVAVGNENGVVSARRSFDSFGQMIDAQSAFPSKYGYAGEYFDEAGQLQYNRARWYDRSVGRFVSQDVHPGLDRAPITLNKFIYANSNPVNFTDPSGLFSMGDVMTAVDVAMTVDSMATAVYNSLFATPAEEAEMTEAASLWDALYITRVAGSVMDVIDLVNKIKDAVGDFSHLTGPPQSHHIIPKYLCGANSQKMVKLSVPEHTQLHAELDALALGLERAASRVAKIIKRRADKNKITVQKIGKRKLGRVAISGAIGLFYWAFDWMDKGIAALGHYNTIEEGFTPESLRFVEGATSCK
jgi:RHS repeat-associated protein